LPSFRLSLPSYYAISCAEAASNLARYDGIRYGKRIESADYEREIIATRSTLFGDEVKRRIMFGNYLLDGSGRELYEKANCVRELIKYEMDEIFNSCDLILGPTTPTVAFEKGKNIAISSSSNEDIFTSFVSLAGLPAISVPFGSSSNGLPIGIQLVGRAFCEKTLYEASEVIEKEMRS
jgi:aspartyl-tRNA(Asn)/glutamyl-tRNA(Gln) amidotransferase subunit A